MGAGLHNIHSKTQVSLADGQYEPNANDLARFWSKVAKGDGCWLWQASVLGRGGHGQFTVRVGGKQLHLYAHRVSWELTHGPIPEGQCVCHHCDVPLCVRPDHLFLGTQADNLNDARAKARLIDGLGARILSDDAYVDILTSSRARGSGRALARKYGVHKQTISRIRNGHQGTVFHRAQHLAQARFSGVQQPQSSLHSMNRVFERVRVVEVPILGEVS